MRAGYGQQQRKTRMPTSGSAWVVAGAVTLPMLIRYSSGQLGENLEYQTVRPSETGWNRP
jgi:hypothetical protein